jgi:hypothetical protein
MRRAGIDSALSSTAVQRGAPRRGAPLALSGSTVTARVLGRHGRARARAPGARCGGAARQRACPPVPLGGTPRPGGLRALPRDAPSALQALGPWARSRRRWGPDRARSGRLWALDRARSGRVWALDQVAELRVAASPARVARQQARATGDLSGAGTSAASVSSAREPTRARPRSALALLATFRPSGWEVSPERRGNETQGRSGAGPASVDRGRDLRTSARCASVAFGPAAEVLPAGSARDPRYSPSRRKQTRPSAGAPPTRPWGVVSPRGDWSEDQHAAIFRAYGRERKPDACSASARSRCFKAASGFAARKRLRRK